MDIIQADNEMLRDRVDYLEKENQILKIKLADYEIKNEMQKQEISTMYDLYSDLVKKVKENGNDTLRGINQDK